MKKVGGDWVKKNYLPLWFEKGYEMMCLISIYLEGDSWTSVI